LLQTSGLLYGVKPVIIAIVLQALGGLARTAVKDRLLAFTGLLAAILNLLGINELIVLFGAGFFQPVSRWLTNFWQTRANAKAILFITTPISILTQASAFTTTSVTAFGLLPLFLFFLKVGSVLFGSGYVLLAFLRADLVERLGWLTEAQLLDAIAVGQITPGPVFTTATFIGYILAGPSGALIATLGIFLPAFVFVAISGPLVPRLRRSPASGAFLDGVNIASLALMSVVTWQLSRAAIIDFITVGLAIISAVMLIKFRINSIWLLIVGAIIGLIAN
ncbi:MAG: chromate efflux transporter, partial [Acidobacteriota bacterium]